MICKQCDRDVADCICTDRVERLKALLTCEYIHIGEDYRKRIEDNIAKAEDQQARDA